MDNIVLKISIFGLFFGSIFSVPHYDRVDIVKESMNDGWMLSIPLEQQSRDDMIEIIDTIPSFRSGDDSVGSHVDGVKRKTRDKARAAAQEDVEFPCDWLNDHLVVLRRHLATGLWGVATAMFLLTLSVVALLICLCRLNIKYSRIARELAKVKTGSRLTSPVGSYHLFT